MTLNLNNIFSKIALLALVIYPFLMLSTKNDIIPRALIEAFYIFIALIIILVSSRQLIGLLIVFIIYLERFFVTSSFVISAYDFAALPLLIYYCNFGIQENYLKFAVVFLILVEFIFGLSSFVRGEFVDYYRIGGIFPSSMHFAFSTVGLAFALYLMNINYKLIFFLMLSISAALSGSRAAFICVAFLYFFVLVEYIGIRWSFALIALFGICFLAQFEGLRAISYVEDSDSVRFAGYVDWVDRQTISSFCFGLGRYFVGSIGVVNNGDNSLVTESSILTFIEGYGVLLSIVILASPFLLFYKKLRLGKFIVITGLFFLTAFLCPFLETASILFINSILISSVLHLQNSNIRSGIGSERL